MQNAIMTPYAYSMSHFLLQTLTVVFLILPKTVNCGVTSIQSTPAKQPTCVIQATHSRDRAVEPASLLEIGVGVYLSALVCSQKVNSYIHVLAIQGEALYCDVFTFFVIRFS